MAWSTPTLSDVRRLTRDNVTTFLRGAVMVGNSVLRVMSDAMAALAHLCLLYLDWQARQLLPDTSEREWLDRHAQLWLVNADGSKGRKAATFAEGTALATGTNGTPLPSGTQFNGQNGVRYESTEQVTIGVTATEVPLRALTAGAVGNQEQGANVAMQVAQAGVDGAATVVLIEGGADAESDDDLRIRVLERIQQPPMGGDAADYIAWAKRVPGVTRAWSYPNEMGIGTVTVRFMMDALRAGSGQGGFPEGDDVTAVAAYLDTVRPVAVKDFFVEAPIPQEISLTITGLDSDEAGVRAAIEASVRAMLQERAKPGQTIFASWVSEAVSIAAGEDHHDLIFEDQVMTSPGHMAVLGSIIYG